MFAEFPENVGFEYIDSFAEGSKRNSERVFSIQHKMLEVKGIKFERGSWDTSRVDNVLTMKISPIVPLGESRQMIEEGWLEVLKKMIGEIEQQGAKVTIRVVN